MTVAFRKLPDRIITDTGEVVLKAYPRIEYAALLGKPLKGLKVVDDAEVSLYNRLNPGDPLVPWRDDGVVIGPGRETFDWNIPPEYQNLDLAEYLTKCYAEKIKDDSDNRYSERLLRELDMMQKRDMYPFLRCLIYIVDVFRANNVVWGVGRGSSCASLVMYLIGVNRVDPVEYDIPIEEFLK